MNSNLNNIFFCVDGKLSPVDFTSDTVITSDSEFTKWTQEVMILPEEETTITAEISEESIHTLDLLLRPQALIMHPNQFRNVVKEIPDIESRYLMIVTTAVDEDKIYLVDREELEHSYV